MEEIIAVFLTFLSFFSGGTGLPLGVPPEEDPFMHKVAPAECLAYISWAGMKKPDPNSENSTEALLAEAEVQRIIAEVDRRLVDALTVAVEGDEDSPQAKLAASGVTLGRPLLMRPTAIFIEKFEMGERGPDVRGGALVNLGEDAEKVSEELKKLQTHFADAFVAEEVEVDGMSAFRLKFGPDMPEVTWGMKGSYLIIGVGAESFEGILARVRTDPPQWLAAQLHRSDVKRVSSIIHVNLKQSIDSFLPFVGPEADEIRFGLRAMGLENAESLCIVSGLDKTGFVSNTHLKIEGEALGLMTFVSDKPLTPLDLEEIPVDATFAIAARAEAGEVYDRFKRVVAGFEPGAPDEIDREMIRIEERTGLRIFDGIFKGLGDVWFVYNSPGEGGLIATGLTAAVTIKDEEVLRPEFDKLMALMREEFMRVRGFRDGRGPILKELKHGKHTIYYIAGDDDFWVAPSFCMTDEYVLFAMFPQNMKAFLDHDDDFKSLATSAHVGPRIKMQGGPSAIIYQDTESLFKMLYPLAPMFGQMLSREFDRNADFDISLLPSVGAVAKHLNPGLTTVARDRDGITLESRQSLPGGITGVATPLMMAMYAPNIKEARLSARRMQSTNNMKQLGLAMHIYHDVHGRLPPAYSVDKDGKPLLSWRVHILPYIEQDALYEEFHLDEPWDSEHNRKLVARMPEILKSPTSKAEDGKTVYLTVRGERSVISDTKRGDALEKVSFAQIRDGTSNTIMTVEVADESAVEWTKPDDFKFDPKAPKKGLLGQHKAGFIAGFCDGSVQFISPQVDDKTLLNAFDRADGEVTDIDRFRGADGRRRGGFRADVHVDEAPAEAFDRIEFGDLGEVDEGVEAEEGPIDDAKVEPELELVP